MSKNRNCPVCSCPAGASAEDSTRPSSTHVIASVELLRSQQLLPATIPRNNGRRDMRAPDPVLQALIFQKQGPVQGPSQLPIIVGENPACSRSSSAFEPADSGCGNSRLTGNNAGNLPLECERNNGQHRVSRRLFRYSRRFSQIRSGIYQGSVPG